MTDESEEWGPWIDHDGKGCPCRGYLVDVTYADGTGKVFLAGMQNRVNAATGTRGWGDRWSWADPTRYPKLIIRYRIKKLRALRELRELIQDLPVREDA